jgi:CHAT domain-containing protein/tetratricopeptide (TPR) repeat protein
MDVGETVRAHVRLATCGVCVLATAGAGLVHAQTPEATPLREGESRSAVQHATDHFSYDVDVGGPGAYLLRVEQRGLDLIVSVETPAGAATSFNSPLFRDASEWAVLDSGPGRYRVNLRSEEHTGAAGGHTIAVTRLANARDLEASALMSAAAAANFAAGDRGWARAVEAYEHAAALWQELGRAREEADAWFGAATIRYWQLFEWNPAAERAARAAALYAELGEAALEANARHLQGASLVEEALETKQSATATAIAPESEALFVEALRLLEQARGAHERLGNVYDLALVVNNFGYTHYSRGELERARGYYTQAAVLMRSVDEWAGEATALRNNAVLDAETGQLVSTIATLDRVLELLPPSLAHDRMIVLDNLGAAQRMLGNFEEALKNFAAALALQKEIDDAQGEGRSLRRIGETYYNLGDLELAEQYLQQALPIAVRTNDARGQEGALRNLGNVAFVERDYAAALDYHRRALEVSASVSDRAHLQLLIAKDLLTLGRAGDAAAAAEQAMTVAEDTGSEVLLGGALSAAGRARALAGDSAAATASLEAAAAIFERLGLRSEHAEALHALALAARDANELDRALDYGEAALRELEALRGRVADPELRALFAAARRDYYETQVDLLMVRDERAGASNGDGARAALQVSERSRARMIADLLQEASVDLRRGSPELQQKEAALYEQLAERSNQRDLLLDAAADGERNDAQVAGVLAELAALENALNLLEIDLRRSNPRLADLTAPETLTPTEMQAKLDADTVLLQFALGSRASYVWVITHDELHATELADRATIEAAARRALADLETYSPDGSAPDVRSLAELAALVLDPVAAKLDRRRVVLALDGALQYVPFAVLPMRRADGSAARLLDTHEVIEIPSMSTLALSGPDAPRVAGKTLAVFADPVLQAGDPRLGRSPSAELPAVAATRGAPSSGAELGRLLSTSYEASAIAALVPDDQRLLASGFAANRDAVLDPALGDFRYIHFATHGLVDARYPGLSALVLSQFDDRGNAQDGFLRLTDIYNLKLRADLVVLSACDTALGREVRGEGLIGLTQGFMAAGARSLVASLWQVPDRATAELMTQFYRYMLADGLRPADALRKAQLWSAAQPRYRDPYFWGSFVLVGEWR